MSFLWQPFIKILADDASGLAEDGRLWLVVLQVINKSLTADEGGMASYIMNFDRLLTNCTISVFWRDDKLRQMVPVIAKQLPTSVKINTDAAKDILVSCLVVICNILTEHCLIFFICLFTFFHFRAEF